MLFTVYLQDSDAYIRKRALELVYLLVNESNVKSLTKELIEYLEVSDQDFKGDLTTKICSIVENESHHQLRKLDLRLRAFIGATHSCGGVYMYSNHQGCDGGRLYYDGCSCVVVNGDVVAQGSQFSLKDVEVVVAQIDLDACNKQSRELQLILTERIASPVMKTFKKV
ncbi:Glutamine-dependent NAD(+) synthetase [Camellia lanceoleosa]|uniref:Glutamine-dependent NAD(+) synthetase n=1 Tax=Camellia lanceoleosa TaxID=1840588 RepID=A0ACC0FK13_9ERIC|nr:Glutamine-dependent NAD(+) synthetase [Camellia lanceoleosa]